MNNVFYLVVIIFLSLMAIILAIHVFWLMASWTISTEIEGSLDLEKNICKRK